MSPAEEPMPRLGAVEEDGLWERARRCRECRHVAFFAEDED